MCAIIQKKIILVSFYEKRGLANFLCASQKSYFQFLLFPLNLISEKHARMRISREVKLVLRELEMMFRYITLNPLLSSSYLPRAFVETIHRKEDLKLNGIPGNSEQCKV